MTHRPAGENPKPRFQREPAIPSETERKRSGFAPYGTAVKPIQPPPVRPRQYYPPADDLDKLDSISKAQQKNRAAIRCVKKAAQKGKNFLKAAARAGGATLLFLDTVTTRVWCELFPESSGCVDPNA